MLSAFAEVGIKVKGKDNEGGNEGNEDGKDLQTDISSPSLSPGISPDFSAFPSGGGKFCKDSV